MSKIKTIFPVEENESSNLTSGVTLNDEGKVMHVTVVGMTLGDRIEVEQRLVLSDCETEYAPMRWGAAPHCCEDETRDTLGYSAPITDFIIPVPGDYRFMFTNEDPDLAEDPAQFENVRVYVRFIKPNPCLCKFVLIPC